MRWEIALPSCDFLLCAYTLLHPDVQECLADLFGCVHAPSVGYSAAIFSISTNRANQLNEQTTIISGSKHDLPLALKQGDSGGVGIMMRRVGVHSYSNDQTHHLEAPQ